MIDLLERLKVALADRYLIERELGAGGMATVYLAQDVRHDRKVAVKVLKPELAAVIGASRFLQEIKVTAHLQHPHILPLFDSGEADSFLFYVMPFIEGESLRDRLSREKQLPVDEAIQITTAVAGALDYAHRHKVIHRDIKPENILLHDGQPVVADFGIALAVSVAGGHRITETGLSLGTPQYMSPEQATADRELDGRSDVYSLGCVLYEMLAGEPPHTGPTVQSVFAKVLTDEPRRVRLMRSTVPPHVEEAVHRALAKLPADRFATAAQFTEALVSSGSVPFAVVPTPTTSLAFVRGNPLAVGVAVGLMGIVAVLGAALWTWARSPAPPPIPPVARFTLRLPPDARPGYAGGPTIAVSPDGSRIVYVAGPPTSQLYARGLDQLDAVAIPGTQGGTQPFFSPDGQWLGFEQSGKLVRTAVGGGPVLPICDVPPSLAGASWGPGDRIVFATGAALMAVAATGGQPSVLAAADTARHERFTWPEVVPDGRGVLFTVRVGTTDRLGILVPGSREVKRLGQTGSNPHYVSGGFVLLANLDRTLVAVPFDSSRLDVTGPAMPLAERVEVSSAGAAKLGVSRDGVLAYGASASGVARLVLVDRRGGVRDLGSEPQRYSDPRLSLDGRRIAITVKQSLRADLTATEFGSGTIDASDVWIYDIRQRALHRLTFDGRSSGPIWTPDGRRIVFLHVHQDFGSYWVPADGSAPAESLLVTPDPRTPDAVTPDGRSLIYRTFNPEGRQGPPLRSLWFVRLDSLATPHQLVATAFQNHSPSLSPDGRWFAYVSDESGRPEVYVRPFPGPGGRWQVSADGGTEPRWCPTGREIFYRSGDKMMAVAVRTQSVFAVGERVALFEGRYGASQLRAQYDVTPDGQSFVMVKPERETEDVVVLLNWFAQLRASKGR